MSSLLLRFVAPMQSWGSRSRFSERDTEREPTKSGVLGLLCAALGKPREERTADGFPSLAELSGLRMAVRVDREGVVRRDFHTAGGGRWLGGDYGVAKARGSSGDTVISNRYYLADAAFVVALEGSIDLLARLDAALGAPVWPMFFGRKAFVPALPIRFTDSNGKPCGILPEADLNAALRSPAGPPWLPASDREAKKPARIRFVIECKAGEDGDSRQDVPLSFVSSARKHAVRRVREELLPFENVFKEAAACS